ncbi:hypothetical protein MOX02_29380 [Methylobacterium oxalidis]|uniref:Uncharacterized protein n=1 Tax=Methylobacterium oxalidis TaxID=944322 RepID=A0A512J4R0_9HYPH|nr:hypothetical protein MOX02_29380 [Methylobacterium oxalidis]GLS67031.1 hypothetical protein GCM10007888_54140 [Methylobacterium oxalidis]
MEDEVEEKHVPDHAVVGEKEAVVDEKADVVLPDHVPAAALARVGLVLPLDPWAEPQRTESVADFVFDLVKIETGGWRAHHVVQGSSLILDESP